MGEAELRFLDTRQVADLFRVAPRTVEGWRARAAGPPFVRIGGVCRYPLADLLEWSRCRRQLSTGDERKLA
jgi:hypothetical protein